MDTQNTHEQFEFITNVMSDRQQQGQPTYFNIKVERFGGLTPVADRLEGEKVFTATIFKCLSQYQPSAIVVELYSGKSHKVKDPFKTFKITVKKNTPEIVLGNANEPIEVKDGESIVPLERHYDMKLDLHVKLLTAEFEKQRQNDRILLLEKQLAEKEEAIRELEEELENEIKGRKNNLGNITLGLAGANAIEYFAKSKFGIGLLKGVLGANDEVLKGLLGDTKESETGSSEKSEASIISKTNEPAKETTNNISPRDRVIGYITEHLRSLDDGTLRLYYEVMQLIKGNVKVLQQVYLFLKKPVGKQPNNPDLNGGEGNETEMEDQNESYNDSS